ncbi:hypothetical protein [Dyella sp. C9]|uniref:hypothetical protein n=1 Tax=Dyella sp. C9 TaxID=2202154 RepID=UPI000DEFA630|nr:hypothetical protein [Dyella sp. C9]
MKLQIEGQHLRVRIGEEELAQLLAGEAIASRTRFGRAFALACTLRLGAGVEVSGSAGDWQVVLPDAAVREHATRLPTREGLGFRLAGEGGKDELELLFDVDVRDSVRQRRPH